MKRKEKAKEDAAGKMEIRTMGTGEKGRKMVQANNLLKMVQNTGGNGLIIRGTEEVFRLVKMVTSYWENGLMID